MVKSKSYTELLKGDNYPCQIYAENLGAVQENSPTPQNATTEEGAPQVNGSSRTPVALKGDANGGKGSKQNKGGPLILQQIKALLVKRFFHTIRSYKDFFAQVCTVA